VCRGAWTGLVDPVLVFDGEGGRDTGVGGRAENVMEFPLPIGASRDEWRTCGANHGPADTGVGT
jgi:hypothetical protein